LSGFRNCKDLETVRLGNCKDLGTVKVKKYSGFGNYQDYETISIQKLS